MAPWSMVRTVFYRSTTGLVGSSPIRGHKYVSALFYVCVIICSRPCDGPIPGPRRPTKYQKTIKPKDVWTTLVYSATEEDVTFYGPVSVVGPQLETSQ
jgi:hypothetical protein